jgi:hypothetical protein
LANLAPQTFFADSPVDVGVKFRSDVNGTITGIRFYKRLNDPSIHTGSFVVGGGSAGGDRHIPERD